MSEMIKILKNVSGDDIERLGVIIANNGLYTIPTVKWQYLSDDIKEEGDIYNDIGNGDIIISDGTSDLNISDGRRWCEVLADWEVQFNYKHKRTLMLTLIRNGGSDNVWLSVGGEHGVPSNKTPWTPPYRVQVIRVLYSNKKYGKSNNIMVTEVKCHERSYDNVDSFSSNDDVSWYVQSDGANSERVGGYGRVWTYDNSSEGDYMESDMQYAFRTKKISGYGNPDDALITLILKEV